MLVQKITNGFVVQTFDSDTGKCVSQDFISEYDFTWETVDGDPIYTDENPELGWIDELEEYPMNMVQPEKTT